MNNSINFSVEGEKKAFNFGKQDTIITRSDKIKERKHSLSAMDQSAREQHKTI